MEFTKSYAYAGFVSAYKLRPLSQGKDMSLGI